ncbi:MAG: winged helix-turn-helix transcriptional regulator [Desulfobacteraceae bacterium]|nr:winged helix-turn-helix transcriptional regulator [Desulfobacteraceae bacterium]
MNTYEMAGELIVGSRLKRLSEKFLSDVSKVYKSEGISFETAHFSVFYLLKRHGILKVSDVARELEITQSGASQMVNSLVKKGLVRYDRDKADKRIRTLSFTPGGTQLLRQVEPVWESIREGFRALLEEGDNSRYFFQALGEIEENIARENLFSRFSKDLKKRQLLKDIYFSPYDQKMKEMYKQLALSWLINNSFAKTCDMDFINQIGKMTKTGRQIVRLAKIKDQVIAAFCVSKNVENGAEIRVFEVINSWRHLGLEKLLLSRLLETMKEEKIIMVSITLNRRLVSTIKLFKSVGFSLDFLEKNKENETGFVLTKKI